MKNENIGRKYKLLGNAILLSKKRARFSVKFFFSPSDWFKINLHGPGWFCSVIRSVRRLKDHGFNSRSRAGNLVGGLIPELMGCMQEATSPCVSLT